MRKELINFRFHGFDLKRAMDLLKRLRLDDDVEAERVVEEQKGTPEQNATAVTEAISTTEPDHGKGSSQIMTSLWIFAIDQSQASQVLFIHNSSRNRIRKLTLCIPNF